MLAQSDQGGGQGAGLPDSGPKQQVSPVLERVLSSAWTEKLIHSPSHSQCSLGTCTAHPATLLTAARDGPAGGPTCGQSQDSGWATEPCSVAHGSAASGSQTRVLPAEGPTWSPRVGRETALWKSLTRTCGLWRPPTVLQQPARPVSLLSRLQSRLVALSGQGIGVKSHLIWVPK